MTARAFTADTGRYFSRVREVVVPAYRAAFTVYTDAPSGGAYTIPVECRHSHVTRDGADECAARLARYIERNGRVPAWADDFGQIARLGA